jgi:hypothetical protein
MDHHATVKSLEHFAFLLRMDLACAEEKQDGGEKDTSPVHLSLLKQQKYRFFGMGRERDGTIV